MIPSSILDHFQSQFRIISAHPVGGGCINDCYHLETSAGHNFLKINSASRYPAMFEAEAKGLRLLGSTHSVHVPEVYEEGSIGDTAFLLMQFIPAASRDDASLRRLGTELALLHRNTASVYGLDHDNYIGSLPQHNTSRNSWSEFFFDQRLKPQLDIAVGSGVLNAADIETLESLSEKLPQLMPEEKPSLLHGDLWSGNYLIGEKGISYVVDPAVYYGHREMDIAMSRLFGGFSSDFYTGYNEEFPLEKGWHERVDLCNLYPLLVHVNLFRGSYIHQYRQTLKKYL